MKTTWIRRLSGITLAALFATVGAAQAASGFRVSRVETDDRDEIEIRFSERPDYSTISKSDITIDGKKLGSSDRLYFDREDREITIYRRGGFVSRLGKSVRVRVSGIRSASGASLSTYERSVSFYDD